MRRQRDAGLLPSLLSTVANSDPDLKATRPFSANFVSAMLRLAMGESELPMSYQASNMPQGQPWVIEKKTNYLICKTNWLKCHGQRSNFGQWVKRCSRHDFWSKYIKVWCHHQTWGVPYQSWSFSGISFGVVQYRSASKFKTTPYLYISIISICLL